MTLYFNMLCVKMKFVIMRKNYTISIITINYCNIGHKLYNLYCIFGNFSSDVIFCLCISEG